MKTPYISLLWLSFGLAMSCSSVKVTSDYDKEANFLGYKTYQFTEATNALPLDDLNKRRVIDAVSKELANKGLSQSTTPDVMVDLKAKVAQKETATAYTSYQGSAYPYRLGGGFTTTDININQYKEGTLFIELIDSKNKQLVWQGRGTGAITENASKSEDKIKEAVHNIMTKYPPVE